MLCRGVIVIVRTGDTRQGIRKTAIAAGAGVVAPSRALRGVMV